MLVCPYDPTVPGGVQHHVTEVARRLVAAGDRVLVVAPGDPERPPDGVLAVGRAVRVPFNASVAPIALGPGAARRTRQAIREFRPDVVHIHEPAVPAVSLAALLTRTDAATVGTFHAFSDRDRLYRAARPVLRRAVARLTVRLAVSPAALDYHARALGLPAGSFRVLPNGVDTRRFATARPVPELRRGPMVLFVGRLEPRKGVLEAIHAATLVAARRPTLRLVVVGEGPLRREAEGAVPRRLHDRVWFVGRVDPEDLPRFYRSADVVVAPALGGESFGIVLLEAMAAGVPVVASDIPGYRSVLTDGVEGRLVPPGDIVALAEAIDVLLDNAALRRAMGEAGRATAANYDWDRIVERLRELYRDALADR